MECSMKLFFVLVMLLLVLQLGLSVLVIVLVRFSLYSSDGETDGCLLVPPGAWNEACTYADVVASVSMLFTFLASILQLYFTRKELRQQNSSSSSSNTPEKQICGVAPRTLQYCVLGLATCWWTAAAAALTGYGVAAEQAGVPQSTLRTVIIAACWASVGLFLLLLGVEVKLQRAAKQAPPPPPPSSISMSTSPAVTTQPRPMFYSYPAGSFHTNSYPIGSPGPPLGIFPSATFSTASTMPGGMAMGIPIQPSLPAPAPVATAPSSSSVTGTSSRGRATTDLVDPCSALGASRATAASLMRADSATGLGSTYSASLSSGPASQGLSGFSGFGPGSLYAPGSVGSGPVVLGTPVSAPAAAAAAGSTPAAAGAAGAAMSAAAGVPVSAAAPGQPAAASPAADAALSAGPSSIGSYGVLYAAAVAPGYVASLPRPPPRTTVRYATVTDADTPSSTGVYINGRDMASIEAMSSRGSTRSMPARSDPPRAQRAPAAPKRAAKPAAVAAVAAATSTTALSAPASAPAAAIDRAAASSSRTDRPGASSSRASKGHMSSSKSRTGRSAGAPAAAAAEDAAAPVQAGANAGPSAAAGLTPAAAAGGGRGASGRAQSGTSARAAAGTSDADAAGPASSKGPTGSKRSKGDAA